LLLADFSHLFGFENRFCKPLALGLKILLLVNLFLLESFLCSLVTGNLVKSFLFFSLKLLLFFTFDSFKFALLCLFCLLLSLNLSNERCVTALLRLFALYFFTFAPDICFIVYISADSLWRASSLSIGFCLSFCISL